MWQDFPLLPESASTTAGQVDLVWWYLVAVTVVFTVLIAALVVLFVVWFRQKNDGRVATQIEGSLQLELLWTIIPFLIVMTMFGWGTVVYVNTTRPPKNVTDMYVVGKQWMWKCQHPQGNREINALHVPIGQAIRLTMTSEDVIHSFFIPAFRVKKDVLPGRYTQLWFEATKVGTYHLFCAEYCGTGHSKMIGTITVMDDADYQHWLTGSSAGETPEDTGRRLFESMRCVSCHPTEPGVTTIEGATARGPIFAGIFGTEVALEGGGKVKVTDEYIRESILNPKAKIVLGYQNVMPTYEGQISEEQILQISAYIKSLKAVEPSGGAKK